MALEVFRLIVTSIADEELVANRLGAVRTNCRGEIDEPGGAITLPFNNRLGLGHGLEAEDDAVDHNEIVLDLHTTMVTYYYQCRTSIMNEWKYISARLRSCSLPIRFEPNSAQGGARWPISRIVRAFRLH